MSQKQILVLNSIRGKSGKDTLIALLESKGYRVHRVAFADILKKQCAEVLSFNEIEARILEKHMHQSEKDLETSDLSLYSLPCSDYKDWWLSVNPTHNFMRAPRSPRWHLQQYGTEYRREFCKEPNVWLDQGLKEVNKGLESPDVDIVVVTDCRLPNELSDLEDLLWKPITLSTGDFAGYLKVSTVRIVRDWFIPGVDDQAYHISDIALMAARFDHLVVNKLGEPWGMLGQLEEQGAI
jgi:hypothetical protein